MVVSICSVTGAYLSGTNVTQEQLISACIIEGGKPPSLDKGVKRPLTWKICPERTAE